MPKRSSKDSDPNSAAFRIVKKATGKREPSEKELRSQAARILGSLGGRKGGPARAQKLSPKRRKEIARKAAKARWKKHRKGA